MRIYSIKRTPVLLLSCGFSNSSIIACLPNLYLFTGTAGFGLWSI
jgi:hypothetical protein